MQWVTRWAETEVIAEGPVTLTGYNSQTHVALRIFCNNPPSWRQQLKLFFNNVFNWSAIRFHRPPLSIREDVSMIDMKDVPILKKTLCLWLWNLIIQLQTTFYLHIMNKRGWKQVRAPPVSPLTPLLHFPSGEHHHLVLPAPPHIWLFCLRLFPSF